MAFIACESIAPTTYQTRSQKKKKGREDQDDLPSHAGSSNEFRKETI